MKNKKSVKKILYRPKQMARKNNYFYLL